MSNLLKDHRLPILISGGALLIATMIGLVPVLNSGSAPSNTPLAIPAEVEERLAALEAALLEETAPELPPNADNARLRQEIDLITKGLGNQTGRLSRLKAAVEGMTDANGAPVVPQIVQDEIALAKRGLVNLTRRINALDTRLDALDSAAADIDRLTLQMANVDRAFANLAKQNNRASEDRAALLAMLNEQASASASRVDEERLIELIGELNGLLKTIGN